jgi:hypothetical protein
MKRSHIVLIVGVVVLLHVLGFWLISGTKPLPKANYIPPPNFSAKEASWVDEKTGERIIYREYKVSTKLALPDVMMEKRE